MPVIFSQENARKFLDYIIEHPSITAATRKVLGSTSKIVYVWCRDAARDRENGVTESKYLIADWPGEGDQTWFDKAFKQTRVLHALNLDADERETLSHSERFVIEGGKLQWTPDPKVAADALSMDDMDWLLHYSLRERSDIWLRDENGALVPLKVKQEQPAAFRLHALRSLLENLWNPVERREVDTKHSGGVLVLHGPTKQQKPPTELELDLRARLNDLRQNGPKHPAPDAPVQIFGREKPGLDPPERITGSHVEPEPAAPNYPRPEPAAVTPPQPPQPNYARPGPLEVQDRKTPMPPGGYSITRGRAT